jgi:hypothetical protein
MTCIVKAGAVGGRRALKQQWHCHRGAACIPHLARHRYLGHGAILELAVRLLVHLASCRGRGSTGHVLSR